MTPMSSLLWLLLPALFAGVADATEANLTCYQCVRQDYEECGNDTLLPCPPTKDRCVTHIAKDKEKGLVVKRECGLGPCGFDDSSMNRGLGLDGCDRSKDEFFCLSCCTTSGCNKSAARRPAASPPPLLLSLLLAPPLLLTSLRSLGPCEAVGGEAF
ncbi:uncharacterized protein LOC126353795 [Schistocerca gregaria]|uniref:uncharacterized protein LOC126353795 n=1 Tax=Schistocerca gregaria TaxID=7010 RepID=UPI00211F08C3|nr:uncharacterized protein LOC126353795 [Schistocerca gregaria]